MLSQLDYKSSGASSSSPVIPKKPIANDHGIRRSRPRDVFSANLGRSAAQLYGILCDCVDCAGPYTGLAWPKLDTLVKRMKVSLRTVQYAIEELASAGWVGTPFGDHGGRGHAVVYHLHPDGQPCVFCVAAARTLNQRGQTPGPPRKGAKVASFAAPKGATIAPFSERKGAIIAEKGAIFDSAYKENSALRNSPNKSTPSTPRLSDPPEEFIRLLEAQIELDEGALRRLWSCARSLVADTTPEEIGYFFSLRAREVFRNRRLDNPIGLLLSTIPDWFSPRRVLQRRAEFGVATEEAAVLKRQLADFDSPRSQRPENSPPPGSETCVALTEQVRAMAAKKALR